MAAMRVLLLERLVLRERLEKDNFGTLRVEVNYDLCRRYQELV